MSAHFFICLAPAFSIGLASYVFCLRGCWSRHSDLVSYIESPSSVIVTIAHHVSWQWPCLSANNDQVVLPLPHAGGTRRVSKDNQRETSIYGRLGEGPSQLLPVGTLWLGGDENEPRLLSFTLEHMCSRLSFLHYYSQSCSTSLMANTTSLMSTPFSSA